MACACMHLNKRLQGALSFETVFSRALQHQCSAAQPPWPLHFAVAVTGCVHKPASWRSPEPPAEGNLP